MGGAVFCGVTEESSRWLDLVSQMLVAVMEEAPLHEITAGAVDHGGPEGQVVHGPWSAAECQSVLRPWMAAGWIELIADVEPVWALSPADWQTRARGDGRFLVLSPPDATRLLNDPSRWVLGTADGHVMLCRTDAGQERGFADWLELARRSR